MGCGSTNKPADQRVAWYDDCSVGVTNGFLLNNTRLKHNQGITLVIQGIARYPIRNSCRDFTVLTTAKNATFVKLRAWVDLGPHYHRYMTGLLHLHIRHCSSAASAVRRLPSAVRTATPAFEFGIRAFSVAGPAAWNSLPDYLRDPSRSFDSFRRDLKTFLFSFY